MYWLAINREWVSLPELREDIVPVVSPRELFDALESLQQRCLIEKSLPTLIDKQITYFTQQPAVMEYVTNELIEQICQEITNKEIALFNAYALMKAQTKDYIKDAQCRFIIQPILDKLLIILEVKIQLKIS
jgi:hypothetical protein